LEEDVDVEERRTDMNMRVKVLTVATGLALVAAGVLGASGVASAQEPTPAAGTGQATRQQARDNFLGRVAEKLSISVDQLKQAFKDAALDTVDQALADGKINDQQAQKLKDRINNGNGVGIGLFLRQHRQEARRAAMLARVRHGLVQSAADAIGITPADLRTELQGGKSVADVAGEHNVSLDDVKAQITADAKSKLDQLVADGKIKQERADAALQKLTDNLDTLLNKTRGAEAGG
jgi:polyhydroxyalkanoate synthesis regulator phasin